MEERDIDVKNSIIPKDNTFGGEAETRPFTQNMDAKRGSTTIAASAMLDFGKPNSE